MILQEIEWYGEHGVRSTGNKIAWPSLGYVDVEIAKQIIEALQQAVNKANKNQLK